MRLDNCPYISFDTETTGLQYMVDKVFGFSIALPDGTTEYHDIRREPGIVDWFNDEMSRFEGKIICFNASFDYRMSESSGLYVPLSKLDDVAVRACLINEHEMSYSLDHLSEKYLKERKEDIYQALAKLFGGRPTRQAQMSNLHLAPTSLVSPYGKKDALLTLRMYEWQEEEIERQGIRKIVDFEKKVMVPLIKAEGKGIRVDAGRAERAMADLTKEIEKSQYELDSLVGRSVNVNSTKQMREIFKPVKQNDVAWITDSGYVLPSTPSGGPSIDAPTLKTMENDRRAVLISSVRSMIKTRDTFLGGHVLGHMVGDRIYPRINQNKGEDGGTGSGRLSYVDPALQQIPARNKVVAAIVKPVFLPEEGCRWASLDQHSFEVRTFAHLVNNAGIIKAYHENERLDLHEYVARLTGLPRNATYSGQANAKQLNLSMIFNSGNGAIAEKMGMDWDWASFDDARGNKVTYKKAGPLAESVIEEYHRRLPGIKELAKKAKAIAESYGYVQTHHGRRLRFPRKFKTYKASGLAIQATSADINKEMWLAMDDEYRDHGNRLIMNTHDSYEVNMPEGADAKKMTERVQESIRSRVPWFRVPLVLDLKGVGDNYWGKR